MKITTRILRIFLIGLICGLLTLSGHGSPVVSVQNSGDRQGSRGVSTETQLEAWEAYRDHKFDRVIALLGHIKDDQPLDVDAGRVLARAYYEKNQFQNSARLWDRVISRLQNPQDVKQARKFRDRSRKLHELDLTAHGYNHFTILLPNDLSRAVANRINYQLERAYQAVGSDLNTFPERKLTVMIHRPGPYRRIVEGPIWSGGLFDGKIHIKYNESLDNPYDRRTLVHEYTHALIHSLARGNVPLWFNEGLATFQEYRQTGQTFRYSLMPNHHPRETIWSLSDINEMFHDLENQNRNQVRLAYEYSHSLIQFFEERYGLFVMQELLKKAGETSDFEKALINTINQSKQNFRYSWESWIKP